MVESVKRKAKKEKLQRKTKSDKTAFGITAQMIVKNEERWVGYAIRSVLPFVDNFLVFDTGSTDGTVGIIRGIKSPKIEFEEKGEVDRQGLVSLRREQLRRTETEWFLLVDGDEIWPERSMKKMVEMMSCLVSSSAEASGGKKALGEKGKGVLGIVCRTRNSVGDVWHYLPEDEGGYEFFGERGHFNLRAFRKVPGLGIEGEYPLEKYTYKGKPLSKQEERLVLLDDWYLHVSHLPRSSVRGDVGVVDRMKKYKWGKGIKMRRSELPEVLVEGGPEVLVELGWRERLVRLMWKVGLRLRMGNG
jgi:glycosyltransferase involved in cell wall biosynthesis